jgi:hypothetical protein
MDDLHILERTLRIRMTVDVFFRVLELAIRKVCHQLSSLSQPER